MRIVYVSLEGQARLKIFIVDRWVDHDDIDDCDKCEGTGEVMVDRPVVDYVHGGDLATNKEKCEECEGSGWKVRNQ